MKSKLYLGLLFLAIFLPELLHAQLSTRHYISPIHSRAANQVEDHYVYLSTPSETPFTVTIQTGNGVVFATTTISKGNPARISIGNSQPSPMFIDRSELNTAVKNKGLLLTASAPFYVSFRTQSSNQAGYLTSKGSLALGTQFRLGSLPNNGEQNLRNFYASVYAVEDNTQVNFSDYNTGVVFTTATGTDVSDQLTVTLNAGETYTVSGYSDVPANQDGFIGALVTASKPITVNTGNALGGLASNGQDFAIDQIVPIGVLGTEYITIEGGGDATAERPIVVATQNNTQVFLNGAATPAWTLNAGDYFLIDNSNYTGGGHRNMYIKTSLPVYVYQALAGTTNNTTPGMNFLPPLSCLLLREVDLIADVDRIGSTFYEGKILAVTTTGSTISTTPGATSVSIEQVQGNSNWETFVISGLSGNVQISSTGPLSIGLFGFNNNAGFGGYYSGFGFDGQESEVKVCEGEAPVNILERIPGSPQSGGIWTPAFASGTDVFDPAVDTPGTYNYFLNNDCAPIDIEVAISFTPSPRMGVIDDIVLCDDASRDGQESFDLNIAIDQAFDGQDPAVFEVSFFSTQADAENNINALSLPYRNTQPTETLYARVTTSENFSCFEIQGFQISVSRPVAHAGNNTVITCEDSSIFLDGSASTSGSEITYLWTTTDGFILNAETTTTPEINQPGTYTLTVTNTLTGCTDSDSITVTSDFGFNPEGEPSDLSQCDDASDGDDTNGKGIFNLRQNDADLLTGTTYNSASISYYASADDAQNEVNPLPDLFSNTQNPQTIYSRFNATNPACFSIKAFELNVNPLPPKMDTQLVQCDIDTDSSTDGFTRFNLNEAVAELTGGDLTFTVSFYESAANLSANNPIPTPENYRNTSAFNQELIAVASSPAGCSRQNTLRLEVQSTTATLPQLEPQYACDEGVYFQDERYGFFDLDAVKSTYYANLDVAFYQSREDAALEINPIAESVFRSNDTSIFARIEANNQCQGVDEIPLRIDPSSRFRDVNIYRFCEGNGALVFTHSDAENLFEVYLISDSGEENLVQRSGSVYITEEGKYKLISILNYTNPDRFCTTELEFEIIRSYPPEIEEVTIEPEGNLNRVTVQATTQGEFEYELGENSGFQDSPEFKNVGPGNYLLSIRDKNGCGSVSQTVFILGFPQYFTPNNDGYNDTWNITGVSEDLGTINIQIFNRFGKLLKALSSRSDGWDGTFNGTPLPSDSYWYQAYFEDGTVKKGHFVLKR